MRIPGSRHAAGKTEYKHLGAISAAVVEKTGACTTCEAKIYGIGKNLTTRAGSSKFIVNTNFPGREDEEFLLLTFN
jgi:hypothetical protein